MATLNTVDKVGRVLDLFSKDAPEWGVSEVASKLGGVPRSSAHAVLSSLVDIGILRWRAGGRYRVGWRILELAEIHHRAVDLRGTAAPYLRALVEELGETCHLAVAERRKVLYVDKFLGTRNVIAQGARVGTHLEPHCTGGGKAADGARRPERCRGLSDHHEVAALHHHHDHRPGGAAGPADRDPYPWVRAGSGGRRSRTCTVWPRRSATTWGW